VRIWYSPAVARWEVERGATPLADGSAVRETPAGEEWLVGEILSYRGEAAVLEPADLRKRVAARAKALARELNVARVAVA
jgi:predicted DNA-binding transcriptional regulator YafY